MVSINSLIDSFSHLNSKPSLQQKPPQEPRFTLHSFLKTNPSLKISNQAWIVLTQGKRGFSPPLRCAPMELEMMRFFESIESLCANPTYGKLNKFVGDTKWIAASKNSSYKALQILKTALWEFRSGAKDKLDGPNGKILQRVDSILAREIERMKVPQIEGPFSLFQAVKNLPHRGLKSLYSHKTLIACVGAACCGAALFAIASLNKMSSIARFFATGSINPQPPAPNKPSPHPNPKKQTPPPSPKINERVLEPLFADPGLLVSEEKDMFEPKRGPAAPIFYDRVEELSYYFAMGNQDEGLKQLVQLPKSKRLKVLLEMIDRSNADDLKKMKDLLEETIDQLPPADRRIAFERLQLKYIDLGLHRAFLSLSSRFSPLPPSESRQSKAPTPTPAQEPSPNPNDLSSEINKRPVVQVLEPLYADPGLLVSEEEDLI